MVHGVDISELSAFCGVHKTFSSVLPKSHRGRFGDKWVVRNPAKLPVAAAAFDPLWIRSRLL